MEYIPYGIYPIYSAEAALRKLSQTTQCMNNVKIHNMYDNIEYIFNILSNQHKIADKSKWKLQWNICENWYSFPHNLPLIFAKYIIYAIIWHQNKVHHWTPHEKTPYRQVFRKSWVIWRFRENIRNISCKRVPGAILLNDEWVGI